MDITKFNYPYRLFSALEWSGFAQNKSLDMSDIELNKLRSLGDPIDVNEVRLIYNTLIELIELFFVQYQNFYSLKQAFIANKTIKAPPFIIGIAGSVAVGKSTLARILQLLLQRSNKAHSVDLVTTDGFLYSNAVLTAKGKMERKGFPDSYNIHKLLQFLADAKKLKPNLQIPLYSHNLYDILEDEYQIINQPDIMIVEGINVLQVYKLKKAKRQMPFVSDFFDFSIYIDAEITNIEKWYIQRFLSLRETAFHQKKAYFKKYANLTKEEAIAKARNIWKMINLKNLNENIAPSKRRANLIFYKGDNHLVQHVVLRN